MRAAVLTAPGCIEIQDRPDPSPDPDEVLVRVMAVGVCGSDVHLYRHGGVGELSAKGLVLGHEVAGVVVSVGRNVSGLKAGDPVSIEPGVPCRACSDCLAGRYNICESLRFFGTPAMGSAGPVDGGYCEYVTIPAVFAHRVPDNLSIDAAALLEPLAVALWACKRGGVGPGSRVLVTGAGTVGLLSAQAALAVGAAEVVVAARNSRRLQLARSIGADTVHTAAAPIPRSLGVDVLMDCTGVPSVVTGALPAVRRGGHLVLVGGGVTDLPLPLFEMHIREWSVSGVFRYANQWAAALALARSGRVELEPLVSATYPLARVEEALTARERDANVVKAVVKPCELQGGSGERG